MVKRDRRLTGLEALALAIDARNPQHQGRTRRVQAGALELAARFGLDLAALRSLRVAALLHDVGKLVIPDHVLHKPGRLSEAELSKVREHPAAGVAFLAPAGVPESILEIIRHHHEHWDGSGYPSGLKGELIPIGARILAAADAFEALISDRPYRGRLQPDEAVALMEAWSGIQFDPAVVAALRQHLDPILAAVTAARPAGLGPAERGAGHPVPRDDAGGFGGTLHRGVALERDGSTLPGTPALPAQGAARPLAAGGVVDAHAAQREVYALYEMAQTLGSSLRLPEVLDLVVSRIAQLVPYRTCAVYLAEPGSQDLHARFVSGAGASALRGRRLRPGEGITGWAAAHRSSRFSGSAEIELAGSGVDPSPYSIVAAFPLCHGEEVPGVITLLFPAGVPCLDEHVRLMEIVARLACGAVRDGRLPSGTEESSLSDAVTQLPNGRYLEQVFAQETIRSQQSGSSFALLAMDLDDFGTINERFGQEAGDRFLLEAGRVLKSHLRGRDVLVRTAGDEFSALLPGSGFAAAAMLAERLQQAVDSFNLRLEPGGRPLRAGLSVGVALYPLDGETLEELVTRATLNQIQNKRSRKAERAAAPNVVRFPG